MDQPGKVANPARGQLKRENEYFPVPVRALELGLARRVQPSRPASACSFSILRLNLVCEKSITNFFDGIRFVQHQYLFTIHQSQYCTILFSDN